MDRAMNQPMQDWSIWKCLQGKIQELACCCEIFTRQTEDPEREIGDLSCHLNKKQENEPTLQITLRWKLHGPLQMVRLTFITMDVYTVT
ncbi:hypothetical protein THRCLA_20749 [Thraustotheca clavata]|uniref:Uncharacterized protein n=1 Tax=Thraustotheca clavata TaxID=74557 RepID=A0A1W0A3U4_9STRA|nr:hypothetical protein THRCLA_20749 [Thraustotheca clavata]